MTTPHARAVDKAQRAFAAYLEAEFAKDTPSADADAAVVAAVDAYLAAMEAEGFVMQATAAIAAMQACPAPTKPDWQYLAERHETVAAVKAYRIQNNTLLVVALNAVRNYQSSLPLAPGDQGEG